MVPAWHSPCHGVKALPQCASGAKDTLRSNKAVVVTVTLRVCHVLAIHSLSSGIILRDI